jgi:hypothetical protein
MVMNEHVIVIDVRMDALAGAIKARDWQAVEWEYDRVRRAVDKLQRACQATETIEES